MKTKLFIMVVGVCVLCIRWMGKAEDSPYLANLRDDKLLQKAEKSIEKMAQTWEKEKIVRIIWTCRSQLGILTDAKSQYILYELWHLAETYLPQAITIAAQQSSGTTNTTATWVVQNQNNSWATTTETTSWTALSDTIAISLESWKASYYGSSFQWRKTANGDLLDNNALTAAHKTLPFNTRVKVVNTKNNFRVLVRINDRWPFTPWRVIDLTQAAFKAINNDSLSAGILEVTLEVIDE